VRKKERRKEKEKRKRKEKKRKETITKKSLPSFNGHGLLPLL